MYKTLYYSTKGLVVELTPPYVQSTGSVREKRFKLRG